MKIRTKVVWGSWLVALALAGSPLKALAQDPTTPPPPPPAPTPAQTSDPDSRLDPLQPDFSLAALPTTLRLPEHKMAFRVTHRFTRSLGAGNFSDLLSNFFGFDSGARIGLELRYGLMPGTQVGVHRTSDRTIEIFGQQSILQEKADGHPLSLDAIATLEGTNNLRDQKSSTVGVLVSKKIAKVAAVYAEPLFVANSNPLPSGVGVANNTTMIGLGTRVRLRPTTYLVGEVTPRLSGYKPGVAQGSVGIEARAGGHTFQINFSNGFGTTLGQLTQSGIGGNSWFIGFNISRKFF
ncbi:MAG TPA: DUF5777 family beta-barrel protein [Vicinamibacterales bacterium]